MWYEPWDSETGNRVGNYPTEDAALRAVLEDIRRYGRDAQEIVSFGLPERDPDRQQGRFIAEGTALVDLALALAGMDSAAGSARPAAGRAERQRRVNGSPGLTFPTFPSLMVKRAEPCGGASSASRVAL